MASLPAQLIKNEVVDVPIGDWIYHIEKLGSVVGRKLIMRCMRVVGPAFAEGVDAIPVLCQSLTDADLDYVCEEFAKKTVFSPANNPAAEFFLAQQMDKHFSGHYGQMVLWLKACFEANYGDFLGELGVDVGSLRTALATFQQMSTPATTAPTGPSGAVSLRASGA
jgi:hypothetical protein